MIPTDGDVIVYDIGYGCTAYDELDTNSIEIWMDYDAVTPLRISTTTVNAIANNYRIVVSLRRLGNILLISDPYEPTGYKILTLPVTSSFDIYAKFTTNAATTIATLSYATCESKTQ
jgi:hypothetical protein